MPASFRGIQRVLLPRMLVFLFALLIQGVYSVVGFFSTERVAHRVPLLK